MGSFNNNAKNAMLDAVFGSGSPATFYLAAFVSSTEVSAGNYARLAVTNNATNFPNASGGSKSNGADFQWPDANASWGAVDEIRIFDASTAGNEYAADDLGTPRTINSGDALRVPSGSMTLSIT